MDSNKLKLYVENTEVLPVASTSRLSSVGREREREKEGERERTQNSELYYTRIKILGSCLFLQSVPANLHASRLHIKQ